MLRCIKTDQRGKSTSFSFRQSGESYLLAVIILLQARKLPPRTADHKLTLSGHFSIVMAQYELLYNLMERSVHSLKRRKWFVKLVEFPIFPDNPPIKGVIFK